MNNFNYITSKDIVVNCSNKNNKKLCDMLKKNLKRCNLISNNKYFIDYFDIFFKDLQIILHTYLF